MSFITCFISVLILNKDKSSFLNDAPLITLFLNFENSVDVERNLSVCLFPCYTKMMPFPVQHIFNDGPELKGILKTLFCTIDFLLRFLAKDLEILILNLVYLTLDCNLSHACIT